MIIVNVEDVIPESNANDKRSKSSYLRTTAKKEIMRPHVSTAFMNGTNTFAKASLQPLFSMKTAL